MAAGGTTVVLPQFEPGAVLAAIERHRVTTMVLPTTMLNRLLAHPAAASTDTSSLRRVAVGASPVPVELLKRAISTFGPVVAQNYGQTEAPMHITAMRPDEYLVDGEFVADVRMASCGRATRFCDIRTVDDDGADVAPGEVGEIVVRGNFVMDGYLDDEAATSATRIDGWHRTGDLGTLDPEGYLTIVGRLTDMIITGGFNVYPAEIEGVIAERTEVHESAVIGLPDPDWGERIVAVVEPAPGAVVDTDDLLRHVRSRLGAVKTPKDVVIVDALPRNANGKILKTRARRAPRSDGSAGSREVAVRHDPQLDLGRALEDLRQACVAPVALDGEVGGVPGAAVDLQPLARDAFGHLAGEQLEHRRLVVDGDAGVGIGGDLVHERPARLDLGGHLGDLEPQRLEVADRPVELPALLAVGDRVLERAARQPDRPGAGVHPRLGQRPRHLAKSLRVVRSERPRASRRLSAGTRRPSIDSSHVCQPK